MVAGVWNEIPGHYPGIDIVEFEVMPNHVHGIIVIGNPNDIRNPPLAEGITLFDVIRNFKTMTTTA